MNYLRTVLTSVLLGLGFLAADALHVTAQTTGTSRTWTDRSGNSISAKFVRMKSGYVVLNRAGKVVVVPYSELSTADKQYLKDLQDGKAGSGQPIDYSRNSSSSTLNQLLGKTVSLSLDNGTSIERALLTALHTNANGDCHSLQYELYVDGEIRSKRVDISHLKSIASNDLTVSLVGEKQKSRYGSVRVENLTDHQIQLIARQWTDETGFSVLSRLRWTLEPGAETQLANNNQPLRASAFLFRVQTAAGSTPDEGRVWQASYDSGDSLVVRVTPSMIKRTSSGPVHFVNNSYQTLSITCETYVDRAGRTLNYSNSAVLEHGDTFAPMVGGAPLVASQVTYRVKTQGGERRLAGGELNPDGRLLIALSIDDVPPIAGRVYITNNSPVPVTVKVADYWIDDRGEKNFGSASLNLAPHQSSFLVWKDSAVVAREFRYRIITEDGSTPGPGRVLRQEYQSGDLLHVTVGQSSLPAATLTRLEQERPVIQSQSDELVTVSNGLRKVRILVQVKLRKAGEYKIRAGWVDSDGEFIPNFIVITNQMDRIVRGDANDVVNVHFELDHRTLGQYDVQFIDD